ncbi:hypothetical protein EDB89DRAFT_185587 [Lactarius sanguifluus]|nr:hypothetical protein EDB89DRAFT_185587 [Lactarius sanguifluus]
MMELLSVAQKSEMSFVLTHIRGSLALQDLPFICQENAFLAYSVARSGTEVRTPQGSNPSSATHVEVHADDRESRIRGHLCLDPISTSQNGPSGPTLPAASREFVSFRSHQLRSRCSRRGYSDYVLIERREYIREGASLTEDRNVYTQVIPAPNRLGRSVRWQQSVEVRTGVVQTHGLEL